jgi:hypothetical protein
MLCRRCLCEREPAEFYELRTGTRRRVCKQCMRAYNARYYRTNSKPGIRYVKQSPTITYSVPMEFKQFAQARFA